jgi:hypothetical protein
VCLEYPRVESRLQSSVLARVCARRFSERAALGNPGENPQCELLEPYRFAAPSLPAIRATNSASRSCKLPSSSVISALVTILVFLMTKGS